MQNGSTLMKHLCLNYLMSLTSIKLAQLSGQHSILQAWGSKRPWPNRISKTSSIYSKTITRWLTNSSFKTNWKSTKTTSKTQCTKTGESLLNAFLKAMRMKTGRVRSMRSTLKSSSLQCEAIKESNVLVNQLNVPKMNFKQQRKPRKITFKPIYLWLSSKRARMLVAKPLFRFPLDGAPSFTDLLLSMMMGKSKKGAAQVPKAPEMVKSMSMVQWMLARLLQDCLQVSGAKESPSR